MELDAAKNKLETAQKELSKYQDKLQQAQTSVPDVTVTDEYKYARFKLFDTQVNGGLNEVCETTFKGVPYGTGLNNAAKINVGLDIINTLSAHYGILAPIFVDNAEAVTKFIDVETQLISLVVSEKDKQLRVELEPIEYKEAI